MAIQPLRSGAAAVVNTVNQLVATVNSLSNMGTDGYIKVSRSPAGISLALDVNKLHERHPHGGSGSSGGGIQRAITTEAAPAAANITCNLYDSTGTEITSGTGSAIEVYCSIIGGGNLNAAVPRLEDNDDLFVVKLPYKNGTATESRYFCTTLFQASQDC